MLFQQSFGLQSNSVPPHVAVFETYPLGARLGIGMDASFWVGNFGGIQNGVAILTNAQLFANVGKPIDGISQVVRIPVSQITFVS